MRKALLILASVVATGGILVAGVLMSGEGGQGSHISVLPLAWVAWAPAGYSILAHRPGNRVGTASMVVGAGFGLAAIFDRLAERLDPSEAAAWLALTSTIGHIVAWLAIFWLLLVFPSGEYASRAHRAIGFSMIGFGVVVSVAFALFPSEMDGSATTSPLALPDPGGFARIMAGPYGLLPVAGFLVTALVRLIRRWRRSEGVDRLQYRWLFLGATTFAATLVAGNFSPDNGGPVTELLWVVSGWAIPASIAVAVLRYRLYEIDKVITGVVGYTLVVTFLGSIYLFGAIWLPTRLMGEQSPLFVAGSTLAVAGLFNPVRRRLLHRVGRRFYRSRYDAEQVVEDFMARLRDHTDVAVSTKDWLAVVTEAVQPSSIGLWMRGEL